MIYNQTILKQIRLHNNSSSQYCEGRFQSSGHLITDQPEDESFIFRKQFKAHNNQTAYTSKPIEGLSAFVDLSHLTISNEYGSQTFTDMDELESCLMSLLEDDDFSNFDFSEIPTKRLLAKMLYSDYSYKVPFTWEDFQEQQDIQSINRRDRAKQQEINEVLFILTNPNEPYHEELIAHYSDLTEYLRRFHLNYFNYDYTFSSEVNTDASALYTDRHHSKNIAFNRQFTRITESLIDLIREYQSIRWLQDHDLKPFEKRHTPYKCVYFRDEEDALKYAQENGATKVEQNDWLMWEVTIPTDDTDFSGYTPSIAKALFSDSEE